MLVHPWDEATRAEWEAVLNTHDFGQLIAPGRERDWPVVVPTHFRYVDGAVLLHLARPNPVWAAIEEESRVVLSLAADWVYVEAAWNATPGTDPDHGVPTSYYTAVQLRCRAEIVDESGDKAAILASQLVHFEPQDSTRADPSDGNEADRRQMTGIRGLRLEIVEVLAKQKYGGNKTLEQRHEIADHLAERDGPGDAAARGHLLRRSER